MNDKEHETNFIPPRIREHLKNLLQSTELPSTDKSLQLLLEAWAEKDRLFSAQVKALDFESLQSFEAEDPRGLLVLTISGSLISLYPQVDEQRRLEYASIELRRDVPKILKGTGVSISHGLAVGEPLQLADSPLRKSSPVHKIAVCPDGINLDEQITRIREATIFLTNGFLKINKQSTTAEGTSIDHFNKQEIVSYIAQRNDLSQKEVNRVIDDYLAMVESGLLLGESVQLGRLGRLSVRIRPPQKARVGRNPSTGESLTIPAKPAQGVPKMSFSRKLKDKAAEYFG